MAARLRFVWLISIYATCFILFFKEPAIISASEWDLELYEPSPENQQNENFLDFVRIGFLNNTDLIKSVYRLHKRDAADESSSPSPPIKKASQSEKKILTKALPVGDIDSKTVVDDSSKTLVSNVTSSGMNLTDLNTTVAPKKIVKDKSGVFATSSVAPTNTTTSSSSTTTPPTFSIASSSTTSASAPTSSSSTKYSTTVETTTVDELMPTKPANVTSTRTDNHVYYNSSFYLEEKDAMAFWVDFDAVPRDRVVMHDMLSDSHRRAATVTLSFDFPFYGHHLRNITIATGGFLYMGDYMHSWLAATQYVAPLMANFDTSLSNESTVRYFDNGTAFVIEWNEVSLQDGKHSGRFSFQAILMNNGNIVFVYNTIPVSVTEIGDEYHPVKVGLSDAYVIDRVIYFIRRKTIYEYHRIDMKREEIGNHTAIYFTALTTCLDFKSCNSCIGAEIELNCVWCESVKRCSDGLDRQRQDWVQQRCDDDKNSVNCSALIPGKVNPFVQPFTDSPFRAYTVRPPPETHDNYPDMAPFKPHMHDDEVVAHHVQGAREGAMGVGGVVAILLLLGIILGGAAWVSYAYRNPHTSSGQLLIRYRPSQWRFRSGEARYTAASVHM